MTMQKGCQKQPGMLFAITDALWAPLQEEVEKLSHRCTLEITNLILNFVSKDLSVAVEKEVKKEIASVGKIVVQALIPVIEKGLPLAIYEVFQEFQKGGADKTVDLLEKAIYSKLEATMATQIQAQFQKSGKQVIQEALKSTLEASIIPAFDLSCKEVFEQIDAQFQKVMTENVAAVQQQFESLRSPSAHSLKDAFSPMHSKTMLTVRESSWL
ncbi:unnamed protein product [Cuscuta campestris]|uniref:Uncharacterized protein n=1 Tax=Cuscuta campestris TaxID=132261 RepID=A0A484MRD1_9ASTE|nr:unnamed protein product [Cuscuta campestris]